MGYRGRQYEQGRARDLRAQAWTMQEIADELEVAKSSVSRWTQDVDFEPRPPRRACRRGPNKLQRAKAAEIEQCWVDGVTEIGELSEREILMAGLGLYAGDGAKSGSSVMFANSNEKQVAFFCLWLRTFFEIDEERLRVQLYLHQGLDIDAALHRWSVVTGIPTSQFTKPSRAVADPCFRRNKHEHGCAHVRYSCAHTLRRLLGLMEALISCPFGHPG